MHKKFKGTGVALVTPFHKDGSIDFKCLGNIIENIIINDIKESFSGYGYGYGYGNTGYGYYEET